MRTGSDSSLSRAILYKSVAMVAVRRQMTMGLLQDVFFSSQNDLKHIGHSVPALQRQNAEKRVRESVMDRQEETCGGMVNARSSRGRSLV